MAVSQRSISPHVRADVDSKHEKTSLGVSEVGTTGLRLPEPVELGTDVEQAPKVDSEKVELPVPGSKKKTISSAFWMAANTLATIGIVFTNKAIFSDKSLKGAQFTFAAFHFATTWLVLFILSQPQIGVFASRRAPLMQLVPLAISMSLNVILTNLSLAHSTVTFYQVARILLTPTVASMNFILYKSTLPRNAVFALVPACVGVGMVSYYDTRPSTDASVKTTSYIGVIFAFLGIFASSLYTVWISTYHKKLKMNSMQLLFNQAPLAAFMLLYVIPLADTFPIWSEVQISKWKLIAMSGFCACVINISQFFIIAQTGPVSSTVVGHVKTCTIVTLGWLTSGRAVADKSVLGVVIALSGIISYSAIMFRRNEKQTKHKLPAPVSDAPSFSCGRQQAP